MRLLGIAWRSLVGALAGWTTALLCFWGFASNYGDAMSWEMMGGSALITIGIALVLFWPAVLYLSWLGDKLAPRHAFAKKSRTWVLIGLFGSLVAYALTMPLVFGDGMFWPPLLWCAAAAGVVTGFTSHRLVSTSWNG